MLIPCSSSDACMLLFNASFSACKLISDSEIPNKSYTLFFIVKGFFLKTSFISALMIVANLLFFSSIHCCFVYLRLQQAWLWRISALKEEKKYEWVALSFCFALFVLNVFVYHGLKQNFILQTKPNRFFYRLFYRILMLILKRRLALYVERIGYVFPAIFVKFVSLILLCRFALILYQSGIPHL